MSHNRLTLLHTFEVAARLLSFTLAAAELHLTQGAVSQRIRQLENQLGFRLFLRLTRRLALTAEGERLLITLTRSLRHIDNEIEDIRDGDLRGTLTLGIAPTLGLQWLLPRLPRFQQRWPSLNLMLRVRAGTVDFNEERVDLAIYYGAPPTPDLHREHLMDEQLLPLCSPEYAARLQLADHPERLADACFIHASESSDVQHLFSEWRQWCEQTGHALPVEGRYYGFNHYLMALQAACNGMGVIMGRQRLAEAMIARGELVCPYGPAIPAGRDYSLIYPREQQQRPRLSAFTTWLKSAVQETTNDSPDTIKTGGPDDSQAQ
ncbi:LysR substrate-binding domain-containing protein [Pseudaeromonas sharmana]|uniref:LysR substrate-binding domain-containing protein n=1 Tax=Pseudaeromonas sharmana TaxID=328412 RepID=A0ABV8CN45_9GAMM